MSRHEEMKAFFKKTLEDQTLIPSVRTIIEKGYNDLNENKDYNRVLLETKIALSELATQNNLGGSGLKFLSEITRLEPSSSVSSMWNFLVKK